MQPKAKPKRRWWRWAVLILLGLYVVFLGRPTYLVVRAWLGDHPVHEQLPEGQADDASRMQRTAVAEVWTVPADRGEAERQLHALLERAQKDGLKVSIAGAKHSMGGHTISPGGIVINMLPFNHMVLDKNARLLSVGAGARWVEVIPFLDSHGLSPAIMQSNNDFSIGGSLSANCHGWQNQRPPIASSVRAFRLMKADGNIVRCSREENAELFTLVLGGYGLFGIILDVELTVIPNERYRAAVEVLSTEQLIAHFKTPANPEEVGMAYGRLCVAPGEFYLRQGILTVFRSAPCPPKEMPPLKRSTLASLRREVYRAQIDSQAGKEMRWKAEKLFGDRMAQTYVSRNQLLNEPADVYREQNKDRTDILHEYFIPAAQTENFLRSARKIIPAHAPDLLNITVRHVLTDPDSFLRYADEEMFSFVMLFNQARTGEADEDMKALTRKLIDAALACGGRYYLTYRLHATADQFHRAYPQAKTFFQKKREYDVSLLFQNQFWIQYAN